MKLCEVFRQSDQQIAVELAARIALKYSATQFDEYEKEMLAITPKHLLPLINIQHMFDLYNPDRQRRGGQVWDRYMKDPNRLNSL